MFAQQGAINAHFIYSPNFIKLYKALFCFLQGNDVTEEDCSSPSNGKGNYGDHRSLFTPYPSPPFASVALRPCEKDLSYKLCIIDLVVDLIYRCCP